MSRKELVEKVKTVITNGAAAAAAVATLVGWHELVAPLDALSHALTAAVPVTVAVWFAAKAVADAVIAKFKGS